MMAFAAALETPVRRVAQQNGIEPEALLAVVEIECGGQPFEADGRTPRFLFERHVFYRELYKRARHKLQAAIDAGLAIQKWSRTTQYRDLGSSGGRQKVLAAARAIDAECANRSCSWGIGQVMGFHAEALGYGSASAMVSALTIGGLEAQVDCVLRFIRSKPGLIDKLNRHDWAGFALIYNGAGYAANDYDTRLAAAHARWKLKTSPVALPPDADLDIPLGRTPVQNAEAPSAWRTPEGIATAASAGTGVVTAGATVAQDPHSPLGYALAFVIVAAFCIGAYFFIKRMKAHPT